MMYPTVFSNTWCSAQQIRCHIFPFFRRSYCTKNYVPLSLVTWNINQFKRIEGTQHQERCRVLLAELHRIADIDLILFQESSPAVAKEMESWGQYKWVEDAQSKTYHGFLQAFLHKNSKWSAHIAWLYTCLTLDLVHDSKRSQVPPMKSTTEPETPAVSPVLRVTNIQLDGGEYNKELREKAITYLSRVPQSDIIAGDGQFFKGDNIPDYSDAFHVAQTPFDARFTQDTYENRFLMSKQNAGYYTRTTRVYLRGESDQIVQTSQYNSLAHVDPDDPHVYRPRYSYSVPEMRVLKPWLNDISPKIGVSQHFGLLTRIHINM